MTPAPESSALAAFQGQNKKKDRYDVICGHCRKSGHTKEKCYRLIGFPPNFKFTKTKSAHSTNSSANQVACHSHGQEKELVPSSQLSITPAQILQLPLSFSFEGLPAACNSEMIILLFNEAIETGFGYGQWLHGEAIAAGMVMAVDMSHRLGWIDDTIVKRVLNILQQAKLPTAPPEMMTVEKFKTAMAVDKKVADGLLRLILLKGPLGNCVFTGNYDRKALDDTLHAFCKS